MILNNIKDKQKNSGFTIVELLVVIVVIGILAAITIVSYTGITTKANTATNQQNANSVASAAETINAEKGSFPAWTTSSSSTISLLNAGIAKIPTTITLTSTAATSGSSIGYTKVTNGVCVSYWDYSASKAIYVGAGAVTMTITNGQNTGCVSS